MKILEPKQIGQGKAQELTRDSTRLNTVRESLKSEQSKLDDIEGRFEVALANQRIRWANEEKDYLDRIEPLLGEIKALKAERDRLLVPIEIEVVRAHNLTREAETALADATRQSEENYQRADILQERLDDVSERELTVKNKEQKYDTQQLMLDNKQQKVDSLATELNAKWQEFFSQSDSKDRQIRAKERELELRDISLKTRENDIETRMTGLRAIQVQIMSDRAALQAAFQELNTIKNASNQTDNGNKYASGNIIRNRPSE